jgi:hypothetical protein
LATLTAILFASMPPRIFGNIIVTLVICRALLHAYNAFMIPNKSEVLAAVERDAAVPFFQPLVELRSGKSMGLRYLRDGCTRNSVLSYPQTSSLSWRSAG